MPGPDQVEVGVGRGEGGGGVGQVAQLRAQPGPLGDLERLAEDPDLPAVDRVVGPPSAKAKWLHTPDDLDLAAGLRLRRGLAQRGPVGGRRPARGPGRCRP
jgi:hypothetical protein